VYNQAEQYFVTFDDPHSIQLKTQYVIDKGLNGIMFWQLTDDAIHNGLLDVIDSVMSKP
jgi:chitinase